MSRRFLVKTLGCKANLSDSQLLESSLSDRGWMAASDDQAPIDLCIINSCTVTDEADHQSRKAAERLAKLNPNATIVVTGCGAEIDPDGMAAHPGVHYVVGNQDKTKLLDLVASATEKALRPERGSVLGGVQTYSQMLSRHPMDREWLEPESSFFIPDLLKSSASSSSHRTRSFLKIQEGCNAFCTYCIIPYGRGPSRSLAIEGILTQVNQLVAEGAREVVLTGTNIGEYGCDWPAQEGRFALAELIQQILDYTSLERLRVSSLDPSEITDEILGIMKHDSRFCPHFHVSLQSPHSKILKLMKRKYTTTEVRDCLGKLSQLATPAGSVFVGMDVITGFPGETDQDFEDTVLALESMYWSRLHVFPYSERQGTPATRLPGAVPMAVRQARAKRLRELSLKRLEVTHQARLAMGLALQDVLFESKSRGPDGQEDWYSGYSPNYFRTWVKAPHSGESLTNVIRTVQAEQVWLHRASGDAGLMGTLISDSIKSH